MTEEVVFDLPATSFSSDGAASGGNGEPVNDAPQDGDGVAAPQAQAPQRSETRQQALAAVASLRAEIAKAGGKTTPEQMARLQSLWRHGHGVDAAVPLELRTAPSEDHRPADGLRDTLESEAQPMGKAEGERLAMRARTAGVPGHVAETAVALTQAVGLDEAGANTVMRRVEKHFGNRTFHEAGFERVTDAELADMLPEAQRLAGGAEKFEAASILARKYLDSKGMLGKLDSLNATWSSIAFDPHVVLTLAAAARRAGIK